MPDQPNRLVQGVGEPYAASVALTTDASSAYAGQEQLDAQVAALALLRHMLEHPVVFEAVATSCRMVQMMYPNESDITRVYTDAWRDLQSALLGSDIGAAALRMWRADQALITRIRVTLESFWLALLDLPSTGADDVLWPISLDLARWCAIKTTLGDAFGSRAVEQPLHDWEAVLLPGVTPIQATGRLRAILIGDQALTLTIDAVQIPMRGVTSVLPGRADLADLIGTEVQFTQVGQASYLVRSVEQPKIVVRVIAASATMMVAPIASGILRDVTLGPNGLTLTIGADRVVFESLGVCSPTQLSRLLGCMVLVLPDGVGRYAVEDAATNERSRILADRVTAS